MIIAVLIVAMAVSVEIKRKERYEKENAQTTEMEVKNEDTGQVTGLDATEQGTITEEQSIEQAESLPEESLTEESSAELLTQEETTTSTLEQNVCSVDIDPTKPMVALTFDDGPARDTTSRLLDALELYGAHATFYVVGYNIPGNEDIIKRASEIGCEIGNHSTGHQKLVDLDDAGVIGAIQPIVDQVKALTNQKLVTCRPPYGAIDERVQNIVAAPIILWSVDTLDWKTKNAQQTVTNIQQNVSDGDIILMHDIHEATVDAAIQIIPWLQAQGYQLVTVSELAFYKHGGLTLGPRYGAIR